MSYEKLLHRQRVFFGTPSILSMSHDRYIEPLRKAVERVHAHGTRMFVQLCHPGRQNVAIFLRPETGDSGPENLRL